MANVREDRWVEAERLGAIARYTRLNITAAQRLREQAELLPVNAPPMNRTDLRQATGSRKRAQTTIRATAGAPPMHR